jgi:predicted nuclease of predicted toxin-antitoxin system
MQGLLLDANLSPATRQYLVARFGFDVVALISSPQRAFRDEAVVALAQEQQRVIVTFDRDFGEIYHFRERGKVGIIVLYLEDQTVESVNRRLERFFASESFDIDLDRTLVLLEEDRIRIVRGE